MRTFADHVVLRYEAAPGIEDGSLVSYESKLFHDPLEVRLGLSSSDAHTIIVYWALRDDPVLIERLRYH